LPDLLLLDFNTVLSFLLLCLSNTFELCRGDSRQLVLLAPLKFINYVL